MVNVVNNAKLAMPEDGTISIEARKEHQARKSGVLIQITATAVRHELEHPARSRKEHTSPAQ